ncbi:hypothetical protein QR680_017915 [Steinernema hermaphroditum]|uniref:Uncharacterized protein n=1 Tax=Steinernema hermaphroditum TaxID=289476 RepID=A0AA39HGA0_9BILA|nr:hypothetical protein QR680_017915 [Steinernema hermaphroditum]
MLLPVIPVVVELTASGVVLVPVISVVVKLEAVSSPALDVVGPCDSEGNTQNHSYYDYCADDRSDNGKFVHHITSPEGT